MFLCGSGISVPQLPDFQSLVEYAYKKLGIEMDASEKRSYKSQRFEEVLGALGRRLSDQKALIRAVSELLAVPEDPQFDQHQTILRLSRDSNNRIIVVTTNFDTLFERALGQHGAKTHAQSFAGQSLPAAGSIDFSGIIHIHGRLADPKLELDATPLVLTSADYGDAYMRSGWASRFLFDLARCKTIVLIGYSANDAPVRYFLNVLEADRARFPNLRPVYAFDAYEADPVDAEAGWGTLAVTPLPYCKFDPVTGDDDHSPLWGDLVQLADMIDHPKQSCEDRIRQILTGASGVLKGRQLRELSWLLDDRNDLWPVVIKTITDPGWFRILQDNNLWSNQEAAWIIPAWIASNFEDRQRFLTAVEWLQILGSDFLSRLEQRLWQAPPGSPIWLKAWRVMLSAQAGAFEDNVYIFKRRLETDLVLDSDLVQAVAYLKPVLVASLPWGFHDENWDEEGVDDLRLSKLSSFDLDVVEGTATVIVETLNALDDHAARILELGSEALHSSLQQLVDIEMIVDDYDMSDYSVPSVEDHVQNKHHNGVIFLVRAIVNAFPKVVVADRDRARAQAFYWGKWPGRMGVRMLLHVARDAAAFTSDEALQLLLDLSETDFWIIRREFALLLRDRYCDAAPKLLEAVEARICTSGEAYYSQYLLKSEQVDWHAHARDSVVWLRLKMLEASGVLSKIGQAELVALVERRPYLKRDVEDRDFFDSYRYDVQMIEGDTKPIMEAAPDERLNVATELRQSSDVNRQMGWRSYCSSDIEGAFETLAKAALTPSNIALWNDFLAELAFNNNESLRDKLAVDALSHLEGLDSQGLLPIVDHVVDLLRIGPRPLIANLEDWFDRLWQAVQLPEHEIDFGKDLYRAAINSSAGRLTEVLLIELDHTRKTDGQHLARQLERLNLIADDVESAGFFGRMVLVDNFAFILLVDENLVKMRILPQLIKDTDEARGLRAVLVTYSNITPEVTKVAGNAILSGIAEAQVKSGFEEQIAANILRPALASIRPEDQGLWGINITDVSRVLREAPLSIRIGALKVLVSWMLKDERGSEAAWEEMVVPFFEMVWPKELRFVDNALNYQLMSLVIGAGDLFPEALAKLRPYFSLYTHGRSSIHPIKESLAPEKFPADVLDLLWLIFGTKGSTNYEMAEVLERLKDASPEIEVDRRFQSLEQRAIRYG